MCEERGELTIIELCVLLLELRVCWSKSNMVKWEWKWGPYRSLGQRTRDRSGTYSEIGDVDAVTTLLPSERLQGGQKVNISTLGQE
jgi:hypothetical protein